MPQHQRLKECEQLASRLRLNVRKHRKKLQALTHLLKDDEELLSLTTGLPDGNLRENMIALTNERLIILKNDARAAVDYGLATIDKVEGKRGFGGGRLDIVISASQLCINNVHKDSTDTFLNALRDAVQVAQNQEPKASTKQRSYPSQTHPKQLVTQEVEARSGSLPTPLEAQDPSSISAASVPDDPLSLQIEEFDSRFATNTLRHKTKVETIPSALNPSETVVFVTEGTLRGAAKADVFVVTDERLVVVRDDGNRIDDYPLRHINTIALGEIKQHRAFFTLSMLEIDFGDSKWAGTTKSLHSAITFAYATFDGARRFSLHNVPPSVDLLLPSDYRTRNETAIALPFLRGDEYDVLVGDDSPTWVEPLGQTLSLEEVLLGVQSLQGPEGDQIFLAITTEHLLVLRYTSHSSQERLLPVPGSTPTLDKVPLKFIDRLHVQRGVDSEPASLTYETADSNRTITVAWEYEGLLEDFANNLRYAVDFVISGESSTACPADPLYWPAQALDILVSAGQRSIEPDAGVRDPAFMLTGAPAGKPIGRMPLARRNALLNAFALCYGLDLLSLSYAVENLTRMLDEGELLRCLTQTTTAEGSKPALMALVDDWICVIGNSAEEVEVIPLLVIDKVTGQAGRHTGSIVLTIAGERRVFSSVPNASIDSFVRVSDLLRQSAGERLAREGEKLAMLSDVNQPLGADSLEDSRATVPGTESKSSTPSNVPYQPTSIHSLSEEELAGVYELLTQEIGDPQIHVKGELAHLPNVMMPDELLLWLASGILKSTGKAEKGGGFSLIALTDRRILILDKRFLGGVQTISIDLDRVNSVSGDTGLIIGTGSVRIQDGGDERHIGWMTNSTVHPFVTRVQQAIEARKRFLAEQQAGAIAAATATPEPTPATPSPAPPVSAISVADELGKLADLMERGVLTSEEFAEQKAKLLNS